jgi:Threonine dehydrogenase and related Zn-dependent dehydrogenases
MTNTMKAVVYTGYKTVEYLDIPVPECGDEDIIIEVKSAAICGADVHWYTGVFDSSAKAPFALGHEFSGVISKLGNKVDPMWQVGDRVAADNTAGVCGRCEPCADGRFLHCAKRVMIGGEVDGAFAKYVKIPGEILRIYPNCVYKLPENMTFDEAAILEPASGTYYAMIQEAKVMPGETVVVYGLGALGLLSIQHAKIAGASNIIAVGMKSDKGVRFPIAKKFGAKYVFASDEEKDLPKKIAELTACQPPTLLVDTVGVPSIMNDSFTYLQNESRILRIGNVAVNYNFSLVPIHEKMITVIGHVGYTPISWRRCITLAENGQLDLAPIVTMKLPLEDYEKGFSLMQQQKVARVVLVP